MDAKETQTQTQTQTETQAQTQTKEEKELELRKDYLANRLPRSYYSPTGFTQFFIRLNPWFEDVTDIYAFFNPEDAYRDDYNQICTKIIGLILWKEGDENKDIIPKRKYAFIPHEKLISLTGDQPIIKFKQSYNRNLFKPSNSRWHTRKDTPIQYISIKLDWKKFTANGKTIMYYESKVYILHDKNIDKMVRDHEIIVDKENNTTEISAGFDCEIINFESEDFRFNY